MGLRSHKNQPEYVAASNEPGAPRTNMPPNMAGIQNQAMVGNNLPGPAPNTAGPHRHDILNKLDPTVDSQSGGAQILGPHAHTSREAYAPGYGQGAATNAVPVSHNAQTVPQGNMRHAAHQQGAYTTAPVHDVPDGTYGPHSSRIANKLDPRVDSDMDNRGAAYAQGRHEGMVQGGVPMGNTREEMYGGHASRHGNNFDPRYEPDPNIRDSSLPHGQTHGALHRGGYQPGPAPNTAGPHRSDFLNKLDPTVDSKRVV